MIDFIELFKWFHAHPETGYKEYRTTEKIRSVLMENDIEIVDTDLKTGLIAVIRGKSDGKQICLRADIDALPITEASDLPYASETDGVMHACGHDFHMTAVLATAIRLNRNKESLPGTVYFAFEPGEEVFGGAQAVLRTGALQNVSEFYGIHADPALAVGEVGIREGGVMAAVDGFHIDITGTGTHAATPHLGNNPIPILMSVLDALQTYAAKELPPTSA